MADKNDKYLVLKGEAGMGNRLLAFAGAVAYCKMTGRKLFVDWTDGMYGDNRENAFHQLFDSPIVDPKLKLPNTDSVFPPVWIGNLDKNIDEIEGTSAYKRKISTKEIIAKYSCSLSKIDYDEDVIVFFSSSYPIKDIMLNASKLPVDWPSKIGNAVKYILNHYLFLKEEISNTVTDFKKKNFKGRTIGLHIRYTDNLFHKHMNLVTDLKKYEYGLEKLISKDPSLDIFLCTDNKIIENKYKARYKKTITTKKIYPENPWDCMHYLAVPGQRLKMAKEALVDMYLLSNCDYLIYYDSSSFSRLASFLSKETTEKVKFFPDEADIF